MCCRTCVRGSSSLDVFGDVADTVHHALLELGMDSVRTVCPDLFARCLTDLGLEYRQVSFKAVTGTLTKTCSAAGTHVDPSPLHDTDVSLCWLPRRLSSGRI